MADDLVMQVGVGGVFALVVLKTVFDFVKSYKTRVNGDAAVSRNEFETHKKSVRYKDRCDATHEAVGQRFDDLEKLQNERKEHYDQRFDRIDMGVRDLKIMVGKLK